MKLLSFLLVLSSLLMLEGSRAVLAQAAESKPKKPPFVIPPDINGNK
jgi:hypothetical protein